MGSNSLPSPKKGVGIEKKRYKSFIPSLTRDAECHTNWICKSLESVNHHMKVIFSLHFPDLHPQGSGAGSLFRLLLSCFISFCKFAAGR